MSGETTLTIVGNLTDALELRYTQNGIPVANFTVASTPRFFDKESNEWKDGKTLFQRCTLWREYAEHAAVSLSKGDRVVVVGQLTQEEYETKPEPGKEAQKRTVTLLVVEEVGAAFRYARATVSKVTRQDAPEGASWATATPAAAVA